MHFLSFRLFSGSTSVESGIRHPAENGRIGTSVNKHLRHIESAVRSDRTKRSFAYLFLFMRIDISTRSYQIADRINMTFDGRTMKRSATQVLVK